MKPACIAACVASFALSGCSTVAYYDHGEWLDRISVRPANPVQHTPEELQALEADRARLRTQAEDLRQKLAAEKSRDQRIRYLRQLKDATTTFARSNMRCRAAPCRAGGSRPSSER